MSSDAQLMLNAFRPADAIDDPGLFAGRKIQVAEVCRAIHSDNVCAVIIGERGLGRPASCYSCAT